MITAKDLQPVRTIFKGSRTSLMCERGGDDTLRYNHTVFRTITGSIEQTINLYFEPNQAFITLDTSQNDRNTKNGFVITGNDYETLVAHNIGSDSNSIRSLYGKTVDILAFNLGKYIIENTSFTIGESIMLADRLSELIVLRKLVEVDAAVMELLR